MVLDPEWCGWHLLLPKCSSCPIWRLALWCHSSQLTSTQPSPHLYQAMARNIMSCCSVRCCFVAYYSVGRIDTQNVGLLNNPSETYVRCSSNRPVAWTFLFPLQNDKIGIFVRDASDGHLASLRLSVPSPMTPSKDLTQPELEFWRCDSVVRWDRAPGRLYSGAPNTILIKDTHKNWFY